MRDDRKPGLMFWTSVMALVLLVGYPLSFGPACWLVSHGFLPHRATWIAYRPISMLYNDGPEVTAYPIIWWARVFDPLDPETNPMNEPPSLLESHSRYYFEE